MFFYYRENGQVIMRSEQPIDCALLSIELAVTEEDIERMKESCHIRIKDKTLEIEPITEAEKITPIEEQIQEKLSKDELKEMTENAKTVDELKVIIKNLLV